MCVHCLHACDRLSHVLQDAAFPSSVKIVEVGPRDGLQNEKVCCSFWFLNFYCMELLSMLNA